MSKLRLTVVLMIAVLLCIPAFADPITFSIGGTDQTGSGNGFVTSEANTTTLNFNGGTAPAYFSGNFTVVNGSVTNQYAAPTGDTSNYISTPSPQVGTPGSYTISLPWQTNYFGLYWGSIDAYNTISFYDSHGSLIQSFTGTQFGTGNSKYVNFFSAVPIAKIQISSSIYAMEADNFAIATPEPASMLLLGTGITGLAGLTRLRRRKKA